MFSLAYRKHLSFFDIKVCLCVFSFACLCEQRTRCASRPACRLLQQALSVFFVRSVVSFCVQFVQSAVCSVSSFCILCKKERQASALALLIQSFSHSVLQSPCHPHSNRHRHHHTQIKNPVIPSLYLSIELLLLSVCG